MTKFNNTFFKIWFHVCGPINKVQVWIRLYLREQMWHHRLEHAREGRSSIHTNVWVVHEVVCVWRAKKNGRCVSTVLQVRSWHSHPLLSNWRRDTAWDSSQVSDCLRPECVKLETGARVIEQIQTWPHGTNRQFSGFPLGLRNAGWGSQKPLNGCVTRQNFTFTTRKAKRWRKASLSSR